MSLRIRLFLFLTLAVSLSMALVFWLSWKRVGADMIEQRTGDIFTIMDREELLVEVEAGDYFNQIMLNMTGVRIRMASMGRASLQFAGRLGVFDNETGRAAGQDLAAPFADAGQDGPHDALLGNAEQANNGPRGNELLLMYPTLVKTAGLDDKGDIRLQIHRVEVAKLVEDGLPHLGLYADTPGLDGTTLHQAVRTLPPEGSFFQTRMPSGFGESLLFLLPVPGGSDLLDLLAEPKEIVMVILSLGKLTADKDAARLLLLQKSFLRFLNDNSLNAHVSILNRFGIPYASTSHRTVSVPKDVLAAMTGDKNKECISVVIEDNGEQELALFKNIQSLGWIVQMHLPISTVTAPVQSAFMRLGVWTALALLLVLGATLLSLKRTLRPLYRLINITRLLAKTDLASRDALENLKQQMSRGLDLDRKDELGVLARAYVAMARALGENIRELMRETIWRERMAGEIRSASTIQQDMLPDRAAVSRVTMEQAAVYLRPARSVGGDLYDVFALEDGRRALVVGDVSDKGVPAALFMAMVVTLVRQACRFGKSGSVDPADVLVQVNNLLEERNGGNMFVTLFLGFHDLESGVLTYASGGHCPPLVVSADGQMRFERKTSGPVVGIMPDLDYHVVQTQLVPGDTLVLYTDGVTEARNPEGGFFGEEKLMDVCRQMPDLSPEEGVQAIVKALQDFQGEAEQADDITLLVFGHQRNHTHDHTHDQEDPARQPAQAPGTPESGEEKRA